MIIDSILAGIAISLGCIVNLSVGGGVIGATFFSLGLLLVCARKMALFTGKVCYAHIHDIPRMLIILLGNVFGAVAISLMIRYARPDLIDVAATISDGKLLQGHRVLILGALCNILIYFAVDTFNNGHQHSLVKTFILMLCVAVFILSGYEHCIANAFYLSLGNELFTQNGILYLAMNVVGNSIGGVAIHLISRRSGYGN